MGGEPPSSWSYGNKNGSIHSVVPSVCRATNRNNPQRVFEPVVVLDSKDLEMKLIAFRDYYNGYRSHAGLKGETPIVMSESRGVSLQSYKRDSSMTSARE